MMRTRSQARRAAVDYARMRAIVERDRPEPSALVPGPLSTRQGAKDAGSVRYTGTVCIRHPELAGERYVRDTVCVACAFARARARRALRSGGVK